MSFSSFSDYLSKKELNVASAEGEVNCQPPTWLQSWDNFSNFSYEYLLFDIIFELKDLLALFLLVKKSLGCTY